MFKWADPMDDLNPVTCTNGCAPDPQVALVMERERPDDRWVVKGCERCLGIVTTPRRS